MRKENKYGHGNSVTIRDVQPLTQSNAKPIITSPQSDANHLPMRWPRGPKMLVPIRYEIDAGKKAAPCSQLDDCIVSIIHSGNEGSRIAMPAKRNKIEKNEKASVKTAHN